MTGGGGEDLPGVSGELGPAQDVSTGDVRNGTGRGHESARSRLPKRRDHRAARKPAGRVKARERTFVR
jgi:hypothetical protein